jgi:Domain of unknown function (DUF3883)
MKKIAIKRLTRSDLTFFIWHFQNSSAGNQKAINLNADVFVELLFPNIQNEAARRGDRFSIDLNILGPGGEGLLNLQRKIVKGESYKNWRLNGEFVRDDELRFRPLREGDLAVIEFEGDEAPNAARMVLIARESVADALAHSGLDAWLGVRRMAQITPEQLDAIVVAAKIPDSHPLSGINLQDELEDAAQGGIEATRRLLKRSVTRKVSKTELKAARNVADETGTLGEEFVNEWLTDEHASGSFAGFEWVARENAVAPFDFTVTSLAGQLERLDVKATTGPFRNPIHLSINEVLHGAEELVPYRIYRVYAIEGRKAKMRISEPIAGLVVSVVPILEKLPAGVSADGISIDPAKLVFGPEIELALNSSDSE